MGTKFRCKVKILSSANILDILAHKYKPTVGLINGGVNMDRLFNEEE
jgi:hypothetical protein